MAIQSTPPIQLDPSQDNGHQLAFINQNFQSIANVLQQNSFVIVSSGTKTVTVPIGYSDGAFYSTTFTHNLGIIPMVFAYVDGPAGVVATGSSPTTNILSTGTAPFTIAGVADINVNTTQVIFNVYGSNVTANLTGDWVFKYYILQQTAT